MLREKQVISITVPSTLWGDPEDWVPCAYCGAIIHRKKSTREKNKNVFCCISHSSRFYQSPKKKDKNRKVYRYDL